MSRRLGQIAERKGGAVSNVQTAQIAISHPLLAKSSFQNRSEYFNHKLIVTLVIIQIQNALIEKEK